MVKLLPLLYLKAWLLPETVPTFNEELPAFVKEEDYHRVAHTVENVMGDENVYLDVFVEEMRYSDTPVTSFVSEAIADIYQDVRNLVSVYQFELTAQMNDALYVCKVHFSPTGGKAGERVAPYALKSREWTLAMRLYLTRRSRGINDNEGRDSSTPGRDVRREDSRD